MARTILDRINRFAFDRVLRVLAWMTRRPRWRPLADRLLGLLGWLVTRLYRVRPGAAPAAFGHEWERVFPSRKTVRITALTTHTAIGEIHVHCPLRGSGDVHACWRLMHYDRVIAARAGAEFVVLASQAEAGRSHCVVALRARGSDWSDLVPAHERAPAPYQAASASCGSMPATTTSGRDPLSGTTTSGPE